ncbi:lipoprotein-releasing ABC transporter permease subunit [Tistrella bauzanensis]|uniref:Lipoprotein-releasing ABC transporter permease subunit n=1 Tax=Tistrella arctica TaxID=3133430 RepID=A0ABU9YHR1_9PROT
MFSTVERLIAFRYLRARRKEGFISVIAGFSLLGIALGVGTLIVVLAVMKGFRDQLVDRILGLNGHMTVFSASGRGIVDYAGIAADLQTARVVITALPMVEGQVLASGPADSRGALVRGFTHDDLARKALIADNIRVGSLDDFQGKGVAIGLRMAQRLGLQVGDDLNLISPRAVATPFGGMPRQVSFPVVALFEVGMFEFDSSLVFMPFDTAQTFFQTGDAATAIEVDVRNPQDVRAVRAELAGLLRDRGVVLTDWQQTNSTLVGALDVERNVMFLILTLIILIAAFNIISGMVMLVKDKSRDIAILRTMGATRGMVLRIFVMTGAAIGVVGTLIGFGLGLAFATNIESIRQGIQMLTGTELFSAEIYFLSKLPADVVWSDVVSVVGLSLVLSFLATLYPAWRAARLDPVEALRYE